MSTVCLLCVSDREIERLQHSTLGCSSLSLSLWLAISPESCCTNPGIHAPPRISSIRGTTWSRIRYDAYPEVSKSSRCTDRIGPGSGGSPSNHLSPWTSASTMLRKHSITPQSVRSTAFSSLSTPLFLSFSHPAHASGSYPTSTNSDYRECGYDSMGNDHWARDSHSVENEAEIILMYARYSPFPSWYSGAESNPFSLQFAAAETSWEAEPNTSIVPFDAAFPGTLPVSSSIPPCSCNSLKSLSAQVLNRKAVDLTLRTALALNCDIVSLCYRAPCSLVLLGSLRHMFSM